MIEGERMGWCKEVLRLAWFASMVIRSMTSQVDVVQVDIAEDDTHREVGKSSQGRSRDSQPRLSYSQFSEQRKSKELRDKIRWLPAIHILIQRQRISIS